MGPLYRRADRARFTPSSVEPEIDRVPGGGQVNQSRESRTGLIHNQSFSPELTNYNVHVIAALYQPALI